MGGSGSAGYLASLLRLWKISPAPFVLGRRGAYVSWISRHDAARLVAWCLREPGVAGVVNATAPNPATQQEFADRLAGAMMQHREPARRARGRNRVRARARARARVRARIPARCLRLALGEFARAIVDDQFVLPRAASQRGFAFDHADLGSFLEDDGGYVAER